MKHIINISSILFKYLFVIFFMLLGVLILPIAVLFRDKQVSLNSGKSWEIATISPYLQTNESCHASNTAVSLKYLLHLSW